MRQAINNLQSTHSGFGFVSGENVFKVCDQPHPIVVQAIIRTCMKGDIDGAMEKLNELWQQGYSAVDIVVTIFRVVKTFDECVCVPCLHCLKVLMLDAACLSIQNWNTSRFGAYIFLLFLIPNILTLQEIGFTHMRVLEGVGTLIQLGGLMARLCKMVCNRHYMLVFWSTHLTFQNMKPELFVV
jgi:replication factor C subunit 2/4